MTVHVMTPEHPVLACAAEMSASLDRVAGADPTYLTTSAKATALTELSRVVNRAQALASTRINNACARFTTRLSSVSAVALADVVR